MLEEYGGKSRNADEGKAQVISALQGGKLISQYGRATFQGPHAVFYVDSALRIVYNYKQGRGRGVVYYTSLNEDTYSISDIPIYTFSDATQPVLVSQQHAYIPFPAEAAAAVIEKAHEMCCCRAFYAKGKYAKPVKKVQRLRTAKNHRSDDGICGNV
ncbi:MAG: hypothetical protein QW308_03965 [Candidatus Woesearchaeota archaeon]